MKRSLAIVFSILSLVIFLNIERAPVDVCVASEVESVEDGYSFTQGDCYVDLNGRLGSSAVVPVKVPSRNLQERRNSLDSFLGVRIAKANLYSECSYSYSCDFPFEHQPQRELFFILRNIRI